MIRSIGSSLLAKAGTGSLSRKKEETRILKPEIPGKGAVGTAPRELVQETNITPVAPGSEKVIRSAPGVESASLPGVAGVAPTQVPLVAGIGSPGGAPMARGDRGNQPMFAGGGTAASAPGQAGRQAVAGASTGAPMGAVSTARAAGMTSTPTMGEVSKAVAQRVPFGEGSLPNIGIFGGQIQAKEGESGGQQTSQPSAGWQPTAAQYVAGKVGSLINKYKPTGNLSLGLANKAEKFGGSQSVAAAGKGSITKAAQNIGGALRSVTQAAKNTVSKLRSKLFGR